MFLQIECIYSDVAATLPLFDPGLLPHRLLPPVPAGASATADPYPKPGVSGGPGAQPAGGGRVGGAGGDRADGRLQSAGEAQSPPFEIMAVRTKATLKIHAF